MGYRRIPALSTQHQRDFSGFFSLYMPTPAVIFIAGGRICGRHYHH
jgi:hypothetical protein